jgi:hypothetical protein
MLLLGRQDDETILYDTEQLVKAHIRAGGLDDDASILFDTRDMDEYIKVTGKNSWIFLEILIIKNRYNDLCMLLDEVYKPYYDKTQKGEKMSPILREGDLENNLFSQRYGSKEFVFPSDSDILDSKNRSLELIKFSGLGYTLRYIKVEGKDNLVVMKNNGSRLPEIALLYKECFKGIYDLANPDIQSCEEQYKKSVKQKLMR